MGGTSCAAFVKPIELQKNLSIIVITKHAASLKELWERLS